MNELTEAAGVTARTVRYYISEGLLPPPTAAGPRASYTNVHLNRLRLISHLKSAYLPLREIRRRLDGMKEGEIESMLEQPASLESAQPSPNQSGKAGEASSYLASALRHSPIRQLPAPSPGEPHSTIVSASSAPFEEDEPQEPAEIPRLVHRLEHRNPLYEARYAPASGDVAWRRIELGPDAELLIREDAYERKRERVEWLINWAKRVFN